MPPPPTRHARSIRPALLLTIVAVILSMALPVAAQSDPAAATATAMAVTAEAEATFLPEDLLPEVGGVHLPYVWRGPASVSARSLATVAPPLEAVVDQGEFQVAFVPTDGGAVLRILPDPTTAGGALQIVWRLDAAGGDPGLAPGQIVTLHLDARVYAPEAAPEFFIADATGSSSVTVESLNWRAVEVRRALSAGEIAIGFYWAGVPANAWLEVRGFTVLTGEVNGPLTPVDVVPRALLQAPATGDEAAPAPTTTPEPAPTLIPATSTAMMAAQIPTATPLATPTPELIIVTSTPTPVDVFEEATRVAQATDWARILGPVTPTPENMVTPTNTPEPTPTITPIVLVNTPTPENAATATHVALWATAVAFTTGTPTPYPPDAVVLIATNTPVPAPPVPATPTPLFVLLDNIPTPPPPAPTVAFPADLVGKIVFLTDYRGNRNQPDAMVINPDGSMAGVMTSRHFYDRAHRRDRFSPDMRYHVYSRLEGPAANSGRWQIFYDDAYYESTGHQLTYFGAGVAWASTWSPRGDVIALVSSVTANDEIWTVRRGEWEPVQLTHNDWEWDHHPSFSPDGSQIVFYSNRVTGRRQLWIMDADGSNQRQLTNFRFEAWNPVWVKYLDLPDPE